MIFYTKQWYDLMPYLDYLSSLKCIEDKEYSDKEIDDLYLREMNIFINEEKDNYNEPPFNFLEILGEDFDCEDIVRINEETDEIIYPSSKEEAREWANEDYQKAIIEFENRPEFNENEAKQLFNDIYLEVLNKEENFYPQFVYDNVDKRLLALNLIPQNIYKKLVEIEKENQKLFDEINEKANIELNKQNINEELKEKFSGLHDSVITELSFKDGNIQMNIETIYQENIKCEFKNALFIENEVNNIDKDLCIWLYHELYRINDKYQIHILADIENERKYITIECTEICFN